MKLFGILRELGSDFRLCWSPLPYPKRCPICGSQFVGRTFCENYALGIEVRCPQCKRCTVEDHGIPDNDNPPAHTTPYRENWVKCPQCRWRFPLEEPYWNGERHRPCGQRIIIDQSSEKPHPIQGESV